MGLARQDEVSKQANETNNNNNKTNKAWPKGKVGGNEKESLLLVRLAT